MRTRLRGQHHQNSVRPSKLLRLPQRLPKPQRSLPRLLSWCTLQKKAHDTVTTSISAGALDIDCEWLTMTQTLAPRLGPMCGRKGNTVGMSKIPVFPLPVPVVLIYQGKDQFGQASGDLGTSILKADADVWSSGSERNYQSEAERKHCPEECGSSED